MTTKFRLFLAALALLSLVGLCVHRASFAATVNGTVATPTKYVDGTDLAVANIKHMQVEIGTCASLSPAVFGTKEGEQLVIPTTSSSAWSVTVPRPFGDFCARSRTVTQLGTISDYTGAVFITKVEPKPNPPVLVVVNVVAYELNLTPNGVKLGRAVGTVSLGTECSQAAYSTNWGIYHVVSRDAVTLSKPPKSAEIVAQCAVAG